MIVDRIEPVVWVPESTQDHQMNYRRVKRHEMTYQAWLYFWHIYGNDHALMVLEGQEGTDALQRFAASLREKSEAIFNRMV